jgi:hypothetical protein
MEFARERTFDGQSGAAIAGEQILVASRRAPFSGERRAKPEIYRPILGNRVRNRYGF